MLLLVTWGAVSSKHAWGYQCTMDTLSIDEAVTATRSRR
jgi:hypothetical protein